MTRDWGVFQLHCGDNRDVLLALPDASVDSVVCDPPYELTGKRPGGRSEATRGAVMGGFMGLKWDSTGVAFDSTLWAQVLRVLKPGGHMLAFGGTRTYHRLVCAIEDAGFEIRDQIGWAFGSGFAKAQVWSQAKAAEGDVESAQMIAAGFEGWARGGLKPAWEPICVARKPVVSNVAANVLAHGTGATNVDACRVPTTDNLNGGAYSATRQESTSPWAASGSIHESTGREFVPPLGRFPANLIHDGSDEVLAAFPQAPGQMADASTSSSSRKTQNVYGAMPPAHGTEPSANADNAGGGGFKMKPGARRLDEGSAARFFYCAKASKNDRGENNTHPTVKPTNLMRYLCRLITPPRGVVLDPFMGSGSTGKAAMLEGFKFIGVDLSVEYVDIAERRIAHAVFGPLAFGTAA